MFRLFLFDEDIERNKCQRSFEQAAGFMVARRIKISRRLRKQDICHHQGEWIWSSDGSYRDVWVILNSLTQAFVLRRVRKTGERRLLASSCLSVCPHGVNRLQLDGFYEIWYLVIFRKFIYEVQGSLNSDKNNWYFTWRPIYILLRIKNISKFVEKIKTHFLCSS